MEIVIALAVFGVLLYILAVLTSEMNGYEKRYPINFMAHPDTAATVARLRKDIVDTYDYPPSPYEEYTRGDRVLLISSIRPDGSSETVVWDFRTPGEVHRKAFIVGNLTSDWVARGMPQFTIAWALMPNGQNALRLTAIDTKGQIAIDEVIQPRAH